MHNVNGLSASHGLSHARTSVFASASLAFGLAASAAAQAPSLRVSIFADSRPNHPLSIPLWSAVQLGDNRAFITTANASYLSDGATLTRVMERGMPIPGQPASVTWGSTSPVSIWPMDGRGVLLSASVIQSGSIAVRNVFGDFDAEMAVLPNGSPGAATRTGLALIANPDWSEITVGPIEGPARVYIPSQFTPPGFLRPIQVDRQGNLPNPIRLSNAGAMSGLYRGQLLDGTFAQLALIADGDQVRILNMSPGPFVTDRGTFSVDRGSLILGSCPTADGSVLLGASINGQRGSAIWLAHPSGRNTLIAATGDRAPGTDAGVTFGIGLKPLAANPSGAVLFSANLGPDTAFYLWRQGRLTRIASSEVSGDIYGATLNTRDEVAIVHQREAILFSPGIGTTTVAKLGRRFLHSTDPNETVTQVESPAASQNLRPWTGSEELFRSCLSNDGVFLLTISTNRAAYAFDVRFAEEGCRADFNADGFPDFFDYADFVECFEGGRCPDGKTPDFNRDDFDDFFDYADFVATFESGC